MEHTQKAYSPVMSFLRVYHLSFMQELSYQLSLHWGPLRIQTEAQRLWPLHWSWYSSKQSMYWIPNVLARKYFAFATTLVSTVALPTQIQRTTVTLKREAKWRRLFIHPLRLLPRFISCHEKLELNEKRSFRVRDQVYNDLTDGIVTKWAADAWMWLIHWDVNCWI